VAAGRNDLCPCGSGAKYKRCCLSRQLEIEQFVGELERTVEALGDEIWDEQPEWCLDRFAEFYDGGIDAFGMSGPDRLEMRDAQLWFLLDCPLPDGQTPLWRRRRESSGRASELLSRSEMRAWRIESVEGSGLIGALCPLGGGAARLEFAHSPVGDPREGSFVVARSVPIGPQRWALVGRPVVVEPSVVADFETLLATLGAPLGEFWRVHGGVLAHAAWAWPQEREHTIEGETVQPSLSAFDLRDAGALAAAFEADAELVSDGTSDDGCERWRLRGPSAARVAPESELGVRFELCDEDRAPDRCLVELDIDRETGQLWMSALTPMRFAVAERLLRRRFGPLIGSLRSLDVDHRSELPRWKRLRLERVIGGVRSELAWDRRAA
jgi:hypothetical protein